MAEPAACTGDADRKRYCSMQARAAMAGFALRRFDDEGGRSVYVVTRWNLSRELNTLDEVSAWLDRAIGVASHQDPGRRERERRELIDAANRRQDQLDEAADLLRRPGDRR